VKIQQTQLLAKALQFPRVFLAIFLPLLPVFGLAASPNEKWIVACEIKCINIFSFSEELVNAWYSDEEGKAPCFKRQYDDSGIFSCKLMAIVFCDDTVAVINENYPRYKNCESSSATCWPMKKRLDSLTPKPECAE